MGLQGGIFIVSYTVGGIGVLCHNKCAFSSYRSAGPFRNCRPNESITHTLSITNCLLFGVLSLVRVLLIYGMSISM